MVPAAAAGRLTYNFPAGGRGAKVWDGGTKDTLEAIVERVEAQSRVYLATCEAQSAQLLVLAAMVGRVEAQVQRRRAECEAELTRLAVPDNVAESVEARVRQGLTEREAERAWLFVQGAREPKRKVCVVGEQRHRLDLGEADERGPADGFERPSVLGAVIEWVEATVKGQERRLLEGEAEPVRSAAQEAAPAGLAVPEDETRVRRAPGAKATRGEAQAQQVEGEAKIALLRVERGMFWGPRLAIWGLAGTAF